MCKKPKVECAKTFTMHNINNMPTMHNPCGEPNFMPCDMNVMTAYFSLLNVNSNCMNFKSRMSSKHIESKTASPPKVRKMKHIFKPKAIFVKAASRRHHLAY